MWTWVAPKWMVKIMKNPIKMDDLGVPLFLETPMFRKNVYTPSKLAKPHGWLLISQISEPDHNRIKTPHVFFRSQAFYTKFPPMHLGIFLEVPINDLRKRWGDLPEIESLWVFSVKKMKTTSNTSYFIGVFFTDDQMIYGLGACFFDDYCA